MPELEGAALSALLEGVPVTERLDQVRERRIPPWRKFLLAPQLVGGVPSVYQA
jgi:hypothetical protein